MTMTATLRRTVTEILALPGQAEHGDLLVAHRWWPAGSDQTPAAREALAADDYEALIRAFGTPLSVTLTTDGQDASTDTWCHCIADDELDGEVRYERWTADGRVAHGYACPSCRGIVQTG